MKSVLGAALFAVLMSGCGELSYKRGASPQDLEAARKTCASAGSETAVDRCLEEQGWVVKQLDDLELFATASVTADPRQPVPASDAPAAEPSGSKAEAGAARSGPADRTAGKSTATAGSHHNSPPPAPVSPMDTYIVSSWWKTGAGRDSLETDTRACVDQLGVAHQPDHRTQRVTRGLVVCMHDKGWKALRQK